jgi:site-specific recombinase XerD
MLRDRTLNGNEDVPLFLSVLGRALTRFGLRYIVRTRVGHATRSRASLAGKRITPHTFRHATALHLLQSGADINVVRNWLGHASIETSHAYIEIDMQMKKAALDACGALRVGKRRPRWIAPDLLAWLEGL